MIYCDDCETEMGVTHSAWYMLNLCEKCVEARIEDGADYRSRITDAPTAGGGSNFAYAGYDRNDYKMQHRNGWYS